MERLIIVGSRCAGLTAAIYRRLPPLHSFGFRIRLKFGNLVRARRIKLVHEISRLARRNSVAHRFVETLEECGVSLYWHAQGIETLLPNGKRNPAAGIMLALLAEMARNQTETLRERINSGLAEAR